MGGADVPDLDEQRIRRAVRQWFHDDEQSRALLERLAEDPIGNETALRERVDRSAPDEVRTYLRVSGGNIEKLVNIAKAEQLHIYQGLSGPRPLVRLFLKPLSDKLQIGAGEPCVVVARIENRDTVEREVELKITGWLSDFSEIEGGEQFVVPASGHVDRRINIAVSPIRAAALPAGQHSLEAQVAVQRVESALAWAESSATLQVPPFQRGSC